MIINKIFAFLQEKVQYEEKTWVDLHEWLLIKTQNYPLATKQYGLKNGQNQQGHNMTTYKTNQLKKKNMSLINVQTHNLKTNLIQKAARASNVVNYNMTI